MVLAGEQRLPLEHLGKDASRTPDIHLNIVLLPGKHDFRCAVVARRDVARHLRILDAREAKVADFEVAVFVDEDVGGLEVAVDDARRVDIFQTALELLASLPPDHNLRRATHEDLIQEILDKLLFQRPARQ